MKIIGQTKNGFILEASDWELARLVGYYSYGDLEKRSVTYRHGGPVQVGDEIPISKMYESLTGLAQLESKLQQARAILTTVAGGLTMVDPIVREVNAALAPKEG